jgi:hypothetical protein
MTSSRFGRKLQRSCEILYPLLVGELGLHITNYRGQGYDNGANMKGLLKGVKGRFVHSNSRAFFTPCDCQKLNALLGDVAKCKREIRLLPRCSWGLSSSGILHSMVLQIFVDISEQYINPIFKIQATQEECRETDGSVVI